MRQRMIKSAEEIEVIKHGARIGDLGGEAIQGRHPRGHHRVRGGPDRHRSHGPRDRPHLPATAKSATPGSGSSPASTPTARTTGPPPASCSAATSCRLNCFPMTSGYYTALERTLFLGEPDARSPGTVEHQRGGPPPRPGTDQARRRLQGHRRRTQRDLHLPRPAAQPHLRLRALLRRALATTTDAKPAWSCARTSTPCWNRAWSSPWNR